MATYWWEKGEWWFRMADITGELPLFCRRLLASNHNWPCGNHHVFRNAPCMDTPHSVFTNVGIQKSNGFVPLGSLDLIGSTLFVNNSSWKIQEKSASMFGTCLFDKLSVHFWGLINQQLGKPTHISWNLISKQQWFGHLIVCICQATNNVWRYGECQKPIIGQCLV